VRKPERLEWLYLDFDGFFASVEQQARPALRGKPIGIVPFDGTVHTCVIACSKEAKALGVKNVMRLGDAKKICPELILVPQTPVDELCCKLDRKDSDDPHGLSDKIKAAIAEGVGPHITCSIGFAANRHLAKIACKMDKPNGVTIWRPEDMPAPLLDLPFDDIPGIGSRMEKRLHMARIYNMRDLLATEPKQMRKLWRNVTGERLWYALHGYAIQAGKSERGMFGHGRVLPPELRTFKDARDCSRILLVKAARRMRREGYYAGSLFMWLSLRRGYKKGEYSWTTKHKLHAANDDQACLSSLDKLWKHARQEVPKSMKIVRVGVTLGDLTLADSRQLDFLLNDDPERQKWESVTKAVDSLNARYGKSLVTMGKWVMPPGGNLGGKISYTRIPRAEDFW